MWIVIDGRSYSSTNGITWTPQSQAGAIDGAVSREYASLTAYNSALWYIGGAKVLPDLPLPPPPQNPTFRRFAQSDVINWTLVTSGKFSARQQHAAFVLNNRLWIFGGVLVNGSPPSPSNDAWSTADGINWTQQAQNTEMDRSWLAGMVQQTDRVTLIGGILRAYSNKVWTTTNGESWTELAPFDYAMNLLSRGVSFNGAMWVIGGGRADGLDTNDIWRSADGLTWSRVTPVGPIFAPLDSQRMLVFNNRMWVLGGWDYFSTEGGTQTFSNEVWSTADGVNWTLHAPTGGVIFSPRAAHEAVVFNGKMWVVGGADNTTRYNDVWSSADGATWVREQEHAAFSPRYTHTIAALNNAMWLFAGTDTPSGTTPAVGLQDAWRSTDGRTWTQLTTPPFAPRMEQATTVFNGVIVVTAGYNDNSYFGSIRYNDVWSTADGITWSQHTAAAPFSGRASPILLNHNNQLYLIGGFSLSRTHDVWRSNNAVDWSVGFNHPISAP
jgi:N-acetylneuraminic acid mutarotase